MTPSARLQSAIEILDLIIESAREGGAAADTILVNWFRTRRFVGSKDRQAIRDHVYSAIRAFGTRPHSARAAFLGLDPKLRPLFDGSNYGPPLFVEGEAIAGPSPLAAWLAAQLEPEEQVAMLGRAPMDLRVNILQLTREAALTHFPNGTAIGRDGIRLAENIAVESTAAWTLGLVDVQDAGSQMIAQSCKAGAGQLVVDLCAGAGGKTFALAADMGGGAGLIATDTNRDRLQRLPQRAARLGITGIETRLLDPGKEADVLTDLAGNADVVLVDAPCSGSGTWRRNPEARWRLTPKRLAQLAVTQAHVLALGAALVKPGGALVYAVCSLIKKEGQAQIEAFLAANPGWKAERLTFEMGRPNGPGLILTPAHDGVDGFFIARMIRS